jgi:hypothetical protein
VDQELIAFVRKEFVAGPSTGLTADAMRTCPGRVGSFSIAFLPAFIDRTLGAMRS